MLSEYSVKYYTTVLDQLKGIVDTQSEKITKVAGAVYDAFASGHNVFTFGPGHAGMAAEETFFRAGGLAFTNPIFYPGLTTNVRPITMSSDLELLQGFPKILIEESGLSEGDILILHSVVGSTPIAIETCLEAQKKGARVFAITSAAYSEAVGPVVPGEPLLYKAADEFIDTGGAFGDACVEMPNGEGSIAVGPTSSVLAVMIINLITTEVCSVMEKQGCGELPVFKSGHVPGGSDYNKALLEKYRDRIFYM